MLSTNICSGRTRAFVYASMPNNLCRCWRRQQLGERVRSRNNKRARLIFVAKLLRAHTRVSTRTKRERSKGGEQTLQRLPKILASRPSERTLLVALASHRWAALAQFCNNNHINMIAFDPSPSKQQPHTCGLSSMHTPSIFNIIIYLPYIYINSV